MAGARGGRVHPRGRSASRAAASLAAETEQFAVEARAAPRPDPARRGGARLARLTELAALIGGELIGVDAAHAESLAKKHGEGLEAAARSFAELGCHLDAMIAATQAAAAFRAAGWARPGARCEAFALEASESCEGAAPPVALAVSNVVELTGRRAGGRDPGQPGPANREIADRCSSRRARWRTTSNAADEKLGITNRSELAGRSSGAAPHDAPDVCPDDLPDDLPDDT